MKLFELLRSARAYHADPGALASLEVSGIATDSRLVSPGNVFVAIDGTRQSGEDHIAEAVGRGAAAVVAEHPQNLEKRGTSVPFVTVESARRAAAVMWSAFCGSPCDRMKAICVTGTCGKSSVSSILCHILNTLGESAGLIGTLGASANGEPISLEGESEIAGFPAAMTTPDPKYLYGALAEMRRRGCRYAVIEASSHAVSQHKLAAISPKLSVFTNISPEHLDYHGDMDSYLRAKAAIFAESDVAVLCGDDDASRLVSTYVASGRTSFVGQSDGNDYRVSGARARTFDGSEYTLCLRGENVRAFVALAGDFAVMNSALAVASANVLGADVREAVAALRSLAPLCGRMETLYRGDFIVMRDFAHTPEAMRRALSFIRSQTPGRLVCVFGCGGDRDKTKRAPMGAVAASLADIAVVTGDNPRTEDPRAIIADILKGTGGAGNVRVIPDRRSAIEFAISCLGRGDTAVLLGKGHETWEIGPDGKKDFDEAKIVREILGT